MGKVFKYNKHLRLYLDTKGALFQGIQEVQEVTAMFKDQAALLKPAYVEI